jgi:hypothetical protein
MKTLLVALTFCFGQMAFATDALELVTGAGATIYVDNAGNASCTNALGNSVNCTTAYGVGVLVTPGNKLVLTASGLSGWENITITGESNVPNCAGLFGVGCTNDLTVEAKGSGGQLSVYYEADGFTTEPGFTVGFSSPLQDGLDAKQIAYAFTGADLLGAGVGGTGGPALSPTGQIGSVLDSPKPGVDALSTGGPGLTGPFNLLLQTTLTDDADGGGFDTSGNIRATPEPTSILMFGGALVLACSAIRRKLHRA